VVAIIVLMNIGATSSVAMTWLYAIIMGLGMGSWMPTMSMLTSTNFGLASYGAIFGMITSAQQVGTGLGPLMAGNLYDAMHTYHLAFIIFIAMYAVAIPVMLAVRAPKKKTAALAGQVSS
jgi:MFS family permease